MKQVHISVLIYALVAATSIAQSQLPSAQDVKHPPYDFRPIATLSDNNLTKNTLEQAKTFFLKRGYGSILFSPNGDALDKMNVSKDMAIEGDPDLTTGNGCFSYIHKARGSADIYFFGNSSDTDLATRVELRGTLKPELWDPATGEIRRIADVKLTKKSDGTYTSFFLSVPRLSAVDIVSR